MWCDDDECRCIKKKAQVGFQMDHWSAYPKTFIYCRYNRVIYWNESLAKILAHRGTHSWRLQDWPVLSDPFVIFAVPKVQTRRLGHSGWGTMVASRFVWRNSLGYFWELGVGGGRGNSVHNLTTDPAPHINIRKRTEGSDTDIELIDRTESATK